jgi:hypothetical protein
LCIGLNILPLLHNPRVVPLINMLAEIILCFEKFCPLLTGLACINSPVSTLLLINLTL